MDDLSAIAIMALLFALIPVLQNNPEANWMPVLTKAGTVFIVKSVFFGTLCFLFSRYFEQRLTSFFQRLEPSADPTIMVAGVGFMIAALAGLLGFSVAIGAFFAGLAYSYDPRSVKIDASFGTLYELFVPFFFIGIGFSLELSVLPIALGWGTILLIAAVAGKVVGVAVPVVMLDHWKSAALLGISMVPRAEIMMIIMQRGLELGEWAVSSQLFSAMVVVSVATTILVPLILRYLLEIWPQTELG
jgi:Kef-type K+ transport system membrane component KefB